MNSMKKTIDDYESVDELINCQNTKKEYIGDMLELVQDQKFLDKEIKHALSLVRRISSNIVVAREEYETIKKILPKVSELNEDAQYLENKMSYIESNLPSKFNKILRVDEDVDKENVSKAMNMNPLTPLPIRRHLDFMDGTTPNVQKTFVHKDLLYLTQAEFSKIPSYMRGRVSYETINAFIDKFNKCLEEKYSLLFTAKSAVKKRGDQEKLMVFKRQECAKTKGKRFITQEDLKIAMGGKIDKHTLNLIPMLRHTSRIQEIRDSGIVKYIANI